MKIIAIDTSSKIFCLGICAGQARYEYNLEVSTRLSRLLVPTLERVLEALNMRPRDFDCFACGIGPGSFTGVRVGMAAAKAFGWAHTKPLVGVPSLDALALAGDIEEGFVVPVIDAKRGLVYSCIYQSRNRRLRRLTPYMLAGCEDFIRAIKSTVPREGLGKTRLLGDGLAVHGEALRRVLPSVSLLDKDCWQLSAKNILDRAHELIREERLSDAFRLKPLYLYPKECQIRHTNTSTWSTQRKK